MAELADALDSGSSGVTPVQVQVLFLAPDEETLAIGFLHFYSFTMKAYEFVK